MLDLRLELDVCSSRRGDGVIGALPFSIQTRVRHHTYARRLLDARQSITLPDRSSYVPVVLLAEPVRKAAASSVLL